jgi:F-type H+-transporting ATPase subunit a
MAFADKPKVENVQSLEKTETKIQAAEPETTKEPKTEKLDAGKMILEHIADAHEWHISGHLSIPLPIIIKDADGFKVFLSSRFEHGHASYLGYKIEENKIAAVNADGSINHEAKFFDLSITKNVTAMFIAIFVLLWIMLSIANRYKKNALRSPKGIQSLLEPIIIFLRDEVIKPSIGPKYQKFLPYLLTLFFFIFIINLSGLLPFFPGGANVTGNVAVTMVLAIFTFVITTINGNKGYWKHIVLPPGVPMWLLPMMIPIEIIGMLNKPIVLMIRLFANMLAGHIIILGFLSLIFIFGEMNAGIGFGVSIVSVAFSVFMFMLELLVAFLQAYVFTLLSSLYFGMAVEEHHTKEHH